MIEPDPREDEARARIGRWRRRHRPPPNEIPGILPLTQILARSEAVAVVLLDVHAYRSGLAFHTTTRGRRGHHPPFMPDHPLVAERMGVPLAAQPRFDVELTDGGRAIPLAHDELMHRLEEVKDTPVLSHFGGGGDDTQLDRHYWLTPHPRTAIRLLFSWPDQHLAPATTTIHADALQTATAAAQQLWPWDPVEDMERDDLDRRH